MLIIKAHILFLAAVGGLLITTVFAIFLIPAFLSLAFDAAGIIRKYL